MSASRFGRVFGFELRWQLRRPLFWIWVGILVLTAWGLSGGFLQIQSGEAQVGGTEAWITSQFAVAQMLSVTVFVFYAFFMAVAAGMAVIQDEDEWDVGELLHATPLRPGEYVWGKASALFVSFAAVLAIHMLATVFFNHVIPHPDNPELFGPFAAADYLVPAAVFGLPPLLLVGGLSFLVGERTRKPVLVYLFPIALVAVTIFLWDWSPSWLDPDVNRLLMWIDVSGFRWLNETWLEVDRGVEFYNTSPIGFDAGFLVSRAVMAGLGLGAVAGSARAFGRRLRGTAERPGGAEEAGEGAAPAPASAAGTGEGDAPAAPAGAAADGTAAPAAAGAGGLAGLRLADRLKSLEMTTSPPGFPGTALRVAGSELRELRSSPGLYLFIPLILTQALGRTLIALGPFDTRAIITSGTAAAGGFNTLALLTCLLLLFYTVEALERDSSTGLASISRSTPIGSGAMFLGKTLAMVGVALVVVAAAMAGTVAGMLIQGIAGIELAPFGWVWGAGLMPTFVVWIAFLAAAHALFGNRYLTYGAGLGVMALTLWEALTGEITWLGNWMAWDALEWTDMGVFPLNGEALAVNRAFWLSVAVMLLFLAVAWHRRREPDAVAWIDRLKPKPLLLGAARLAPLGLVPVALGTWLWLGVQNGFQGDAREQAEEDYWKRNFATYREHPLPSVDHLELDLRLRPSERGLESRGEMLLVNENDSTLRRIPLTGGFHWRDVRWSMAGDSVEPEDREGLYVFRPEGGMAPGDSVRVGWSFRGSYPDGWTENGGGTGTFVLPAGVVIHTFGPAMTPVPGFVESVGQSEERDYDPEDPEEGWWRGRTDPFVGFGSPFSARLTVTGPAGGWRYNSVGVLTADSTHDGLRTMTWTTEYPVRFTNVVAGKWDVRESTVVGAGGDTARTEVWYHPEHTYRLDQVGHALDAAREHYAVWFAPFPWRTLKLSEFPGLATYAQGFPSNITFSEGIGFLTKSQDDQDAAFMVTAHEAAHQWWGNLLTPGDGPGGNILSEGMAHFSTAMLIREEKGDAARRAFMKHIESSYNEDRQADAERPLVETTGTRPGDQTVTYDKGGWVFWMLKEHMGRENMLEGLRSFVDTYRHGPDYPVLQDFLRHMRPFAPDSAAFEEFADRWFRDVVVPEYRIRSVDTRRDSASGQWVTELAVENIGTGAPEVTLAVAAGERGDVSAETPAGVEDTLRAEGSAAGQGGGSREPPADTSAAGREGGSYEPSGGVNATSTQGAPDDDTMTVAGSQAGGDVSAETLSTDGGSASAAAGDTSLTGGGVGVRATSDTATGGARDPAGQGKPGYRDARVKATIPAGDTATVTIWSSFEPERAVVDPDVQLLMLERDAARREVE